MLPRAPSFIAREYAHQRDPAGAERSDFTETVYWHPSSSRPDWDTRRSIPASDDIARYQVPVAGHTVDGASERSRGRSRRASRSASIRSCRSKSAPVDRRAHSRGQRQRREASRQLHADTQQSVCRRLGPEDSRSLFKDSINPSQSEGPQDLPCEADRATGRREPRDPRQQHAGRGARFDPP